MVYTEEQTKRLQEEYVAEPTRATVDRLAEEFDVSSRSVIGKLVSLGVYQVPKRTTKLGLPVELKKDLAKEISDFFGLELPSLVKAEREELRALRDAIKNPDNLNAILIDLEADG